MQTATQEESKILDTKIRFFRDGDGDVWCIRKSRSGVFQTSVRATEAEAFHSDFRVNSAEQIRFWCGVHKIDEAILAFIDEPFDSEPAATGASVLAEKHLKNYREFKVDDRHFHAMRGEKLWFVAQVGSDDIKGVEAHPSASSRRIAEAAGLV